MSNFKIRPYYLYLQNKPTQEVVRHYHLIINQGNTVSREAPRPTISRIEALIPITSAMRTEENIETEWKRKVDGREKEFQSICKAFLVRLSSAAWDGVQLLAVGGQILYPRATRSFLQHLT
jgi:hypothetical protein